MEPIYLDHNSTTPIDPQVVEAMADCYRAGYANPASQHGAGRRARRAIEDARDDIAHILGARCDSNRDQLVFTSGGTESNNLAIRGLPQRTGKVLVSAIEHPSVVGAAKELSAVRFVVETIPVSGRGSVDVEYLQRQLADKPALVSVMLGNNETGVIQPLADIAEWCRQADVPLHTDAVQAVGKLPVDFQQLRVSAMSISAHKFHGPRGIGALILGHGVPLRPLLAGGFQQLGLRPGTEPIALVVGMQKALKLWQDEAISRTARMQQLRDRLETALLASDLPVVINGAEPRLPHTSNVSFPGLDRQALLMALDAVGVQCSTGSACASGSSEPSAVLQAMGCPRNIVNSSIRISLGVTTSIREIDEAASRILTVVRDLETPR